MYIYIYIWWWWLVVDRPAAVRPDAPSLLPEGWSLQWPNAGPKSPIRYTSKRYCRHNRPARIHSRVLNAASGKQKTTIRDRFQGARVHVSGAGKSICADTSRAASNPCSGTSGANNLHTRQLREWALTQGGPPTRGRGQRTIAQHGHNGGIAEL